MGARRRLYLAVITCRLGLGAVIRHTVGAIAALFALVSLIPQVIHEMPAPWETPDRQVHA